MKKTIVLVLGVMLITLLVGCNSDPVPEINDAREEPVIENNIRPDLSIADIEKGIKLPKDNNDDGDGDGDFTSQVSTKDNPIPYNHYNYNRIYHVDLNGNGVPERTTVISVGEAPNRVISISVSDSSLAIETDVAQTVEGFQILDLNEEDPFKEIAIYSKREDDGISIDLYYFDGKAIQFMGNLQDVRIEEIFTNEEIQELITQRST